MIVNFELLSRYSLSYIDVKDPRYLRSLDVNGDFIHLCDLDAPLLR